ncbi:MAG: hypothetical protein JXA20_02115 [Spirochaetes bacterium]|nr:hypothetical protein [Spirochaetota bacterium]
MKIAGYILFVAGTMAALIVASSPRPLSACFAAAAVIGAAGALLVRLSCAHAVPGGRGGTEFLSRGMRETAEELHDSAVRLSETPAGSGRSDAEMKERIEEMMRLCDRFIDMRGAMLSSIGEAETAEVLSHFSHGERSLHRAWSALVDGNRTEAEDSLRAAARGFDGTLRTLVTLLA